MLYFAYGSNLCESRLLDRVPGAHFVSPARLRHHTLRFHKRGADGSGKADAYAVADGSVMWGAVAKLPADGLTMLDAYEPGYERVLLTVGVGADSHEAWVYRATPAVVDPTIEPHRWYLDHVIRGGEARGLPRTYLEQLARAPARALPGPTPRAC